MTESIKVTESVTGKMTSLQIAEITGKQHKDVLEAIRKMETAWTKVNGRKFPPVEYVDAKGEKRPMYELSKSECLYIATKFNDEARAKLILRWEQLETERQQPLTSAEMFLRNAQLMVEQERRMSKVEKEVAELKAQTATRPDYFTIVGYATLKGIKVPLPLAASLGRAATKICKAHGWFTDKVSDTRYGMVKVYPREALDEAFGQSLTKGGAK
jgi:Rha family phage regulatory protein